MLALCHAETPFKTPRDEPSRAEWASDRSAGAYPSLSTIRNGLLSSFFRCHRDCSTLLGIRQGRAASFDKLLRHAAQLLRVLSGCTWVSSAGFVVRASALEDALKRVLQTGSTSPGNGIPWLRTQSAAGTFQC
jgi:hypothetical protein